jgi:para-nitrobenzyl esterase
MATREVVRRIGGLGSVRGLPVGEIIAFRALPYAAPPRGSRRFTPPAPPPPWEGVRDATRRGSIAPQTASRVDAAMGPITAAQDEDCLTLTVWTAVDNGANAPVMVWLHGGAFITGAGSLPWYDGGNLAAQHGVVVVGVNYRLGALGFLSVPDILPGNLGILDQIAALRWVQENIETFGGNPDNVTVMGQSGGAHNITSFLAIGGTENLFRRAVLQSAPFSVTLLDREEAAWRAGVFLGHLGLDPQNRNLMEHLRDCSVEQILAAQVRTAIDLSAMDKGDLRPPFLPTNGAPHGFPGSELTTRAAANAATRGIAVLIGWTREEANLFLGSNPKLAAMEEAELANRAANICGPAADSMIAVARAARPAATPVQVFADLMTEVHFAAPTIAMARRIAQAGGRVFLYRFDWQSPSPALGACHCLEIPFVLGTWRAWTNAAILAGADELAIQKLSADMRRRWTRFAATGDPGFAPVEDGAMPIMVFDNESRVTTAGKQ